MRIPRHSLALPGLSAFALLAGCATVAEEANEAVGFEYVAALAGASGTGKAEVSLNDATNTVCTDLELSAGVQATVAHLVGPGDTLVATIAAPGKSGRSNDSADCDSIPDAQLDAIKADPGAFKIHVAATNGDLIGTLRKEM